MTLLLAILEDNENAAQLQVDEVDHHAFEEILSAGGNSSSSTGSRCRISGNHILLNNSVRHSSHRGEYLDLKTDSECAIRHQPLAQRPQRMDE
jgi:hypothetical protein